MAKTLRPATAALMLAGFLLAPACDREHQSGEQSLYDLRCEFLSEPLGIDNPQPRLSWKMQAPGFGVHQNAFQILVSDSKALLDADRGSVWNSGKRTCGHASAVKYTGRPLKAGGRYYWKVRVWDHNDTSWPWSDPASWEMAKSPGSDGNAQWIGRESSLAEHETSTEPAPHIRKEFYLPDQPGRARLYISGLGYYEAMINGVKVGENVLTPAPSNYDRRDLRDLLYYYDDQSTTRVYYNTYDVSSLLRPGQNAIGVVLGNGWYNQRDRTVEGKMWYDTPRMIAELHIENPSGTQSAIIVSDSTWKVTTGPLIHDGIFTGEVYDARLDLGEWAMAGYNDRSWEPVGVMRAPTGQLVAQTAPPDKVINTITPARISRTDKGLFTVDVGMMISGWPVLRVNGTAGQPITMRYYEELGGDYGQKDIYIPSGNGPETFEPRFTWHAFRRFTIQGLEQRPKPEDISIRIVHTAVDTTGHFQCSNPMFNKINDNYVRTQLGNLHGSFSSDCPHRERLGYTGDGQVVAAASMYSFDMRQVYLKWLDDIEDARNKETGYVPHTAPFGGGGGGPAWGSAIVIVPWQYYLFYGDSTVLRKHYAGMTHWIKYLGTRTDGNHIVVREEPNGWCLGDWATPGPVEIPEPLVNTAYYFYTATIMTDVARILGYPKDADRYGTLTRKIKEAFNEKYFVPERNTYWEGRQGANVFPLAFGLVPPDMEQAVADNVARHLLQTDRHFDTGILATPLLLKVLTKYGYDHLAYDVMDQRSFPGFGDYIVEKGATTLWENWDGRGSHSHPMFGSVVEWMYNSLGGIRPLKHQPGFKQFVLRPHCIDQLDSVHSQFRSVYGIIKSRWTRVGDIFSWDVRVPHNTSAKVYMPGTSMELITVNGLEAGRNQHVEFIEQLPEYSLFRLGSGTYNIRANVND